MDVSWRINVELNDVSQKTIVTEPDGTGATIVASKQSVEKPILFNKGDTSRILNLFGIPDYSEQGLLEAIQFNKSYPLWLVSPAKILKRSYIKLSSIIESAKDYIIGSVSDFNSANFNCGVDLVNGAYSNLDTSTINNEGKDGFKIYCNEDSSIQLGFYIDEEIDPKTGATVLKYNIRDDEGSESGITGTWTLDTVNHTLSISLTDFDINKTYYLSYYRYSSNVVGYIIQRGVGNYITNITFTKKDGAYSGSTKIPYIQMDLYNKSYSGEKQKISTAKFTYEYDGKDSYGNSYNLETVFNSNDFMEAVYVDSSLITTKQMIVNLEKVSSNNLNPSDPETIIENRTDGYANPTKSIIEQIRTKTYSDFLGTSRSELPDGVNFDKAFNFYKKSNIYSPDVLFDCINASDETIRTTIFDGYATLRGGVGGAEDPRDAYQPYVRVLLPMQSTDAKQDSTNGLYKEMDSVPAGRGFSVYAGKFKRLNAYSQKHKYLECVPMGSIAKNHSDSIVYSKGGYAVAWINEDGVGGQLNDSTLTDLATNQEEWTQSELKLLNENRINPVIYDDSYGIMIVSRRTTFDGYSDYSFNDYSGIMDYILKNLIKNVLPYQIVKKNDAEHRALVYARTENIIRPLATDPLNLIRDYAIKCDEENNDDEAMANEEFHLDLAVKMSPKSETIWLKFSNVGQTLDVEEIVNGN